MASRAPTRLASPGGGAARLRRSGLSHAPSDLSVQIVTTNVMVRAYRFAFFLFRHELETVRELALEKEHAGFPWKG